MPISRLLRRARPRSISRYALAFFVVLAAALGMLAAAILHDVARLNQRIAQSDETLAKQELTEAIALLSQHAEQVAQKLIHWDEARAQLQDSTYYGYWRNSRALAAGVLPGAIDAIDLYDSHGRNLSPVTLNESYMPPRISAADMRPVLVHERGHDHLYFFFPFTRDAGHPLGYAGLKFDFIEKLNELRKFRYLDLGSVRVDAAEGARLPLDAVAPRLRFRTVPNPETRALEGLVKESFYELAIIVSVLSLLGYVALVSVVAKPLGRLSRHIESIRSGHASLLDESYRGPLAVTELENVRQSLNDYQQQLDSMHVSLAHKNEELWVMAHHDPLTGMFNRRAFDDDWIALRRAPGMSQTQIAFLLFDCDHFKAINDTYGHQTGDQVIQGLAESLHGALRTGDRLYRLGGDEFATVLFDTDTERARQVAERCVEQVNRHDFTAYGVREPVRISVGVSHAAAAAATDDTLRLLHRQADVAMYHAKRPGQAKIAVYCADMGEGNAALVSNAETSAVYQAIADPDRIEMHYQPVIALPAARIEYYEALARIRDGDTLVPPSGIFPVVELRGLELEFDLAVMERVWRDLKEGVIPAGAGVSINVSGPGIVNARLIDKLMQFAPLLADYKLVLEVTETSLITQIAQASANLAQLRRTGFVIALDDFGSGYSSLRYLSSMPVDLVKFDISMVRSLEDHGRQAMLVEDLARMIKDAGYALVAEGIESEALLQRVAAIGFSHAQGFHIGRPVPLGAARRAPAEALRTAT